MSWFKRWRRTDQRTEWAPLAWWCMPTESGDTLSVAPDHGSLRINIDTDTHSIETTLTIGQAYGLVGTLQDAAREAAKERA